MDDKAKLYETLGELLYVISMADGGIQDEEKAKLEVVLGQHPYGKEVLWSFNYEQKKASPTTNLYKKVINYCHTYGPTHEFEEFITLMETIAASSNGIDENEQQVVRSFSADLIARFRKDIEEIKTNKR